MCIFLKLLNNEIKNKNINADNCNYIVSVFSKKNENSLMKAHNFGYQITSTPRQKTQNFFQKMQKKCSKFKYTARSRFFWLNEKRKQAN